MEAANQVAAYISKMVEQPIRDHYLLGEILIYIRCKHKIYVNLKGLTRLSLKQNTTIADVITVQPSTRYRMGTNHTRIFIEKTKEGAYYTSCYSHTTKTPFFRYKILP